MRQWWLVVAGGLVWAVPAAAQDLGATWQAGGAPVLDVNVQGVYGRAVGEFADHVRHGGGLNVSAVWPSNNWVGVRADGGFLVYGSETQEVCFGGGVGCRVRLDLTTTNSIVYGQVGPQLMIPRGPVRPYVNAGVGFSYFGTNSSISGTSNDEDFASTNNFDDVTLAWAAGGGLLIPVSAGRTPVSIDLSARYHANGQVEYLKKGDIVDDPQSDEIRFTPTRSAADLVTFQIGVSVGVGPGGN